MKKSLLWIVVLMLIMSMTAVFILSGCEKAEEVAEEEEEEEEAEEEEEEEEAEPVTLSFLIFDVDYTDGIIAQLDAMEEQLNIKAEVEILPRAEADTIILARLATGEMADVFGYNTGALLQTLNPGETLVDISDQPFVGNLTDEFINSASVDGALYGVPLRDGTVGGIVYNTDIYEELELEIPTTWDQFIENCETIDDAGYTAVLGTYGDTWTSQLLVLADNYNVIALEPDFAANYTANIAHFADTTAALRSFEKLAEPKLKDLMNEDFATLTYADGQRLFAEGNVAHYPMLSFLFSVLDTTYPEAIEFTGMFPEPSDDASINGITSWGVIGAWYVPKTCSDIDSAMKALEFLKSQAGIDAYASGMKISGPLAMTGLDLPSNTLGVVAQIQAYFDAGLSTPALEYLSPVKGPNLPQICVEVGSGIKTPLEGAQAYDEDVKAQAQQLGLEGW